MTKPRTTRGGATITEKGIDLTPLRLAELRKEWPDAGWQAEFEFHETRKFRFDFASPIYRVAIEIQGGIFRRGKRCPACGQRRVGAHSSIKDQLRDIERENAATVAGWRILKFTPNQFANWGHVRNLVDPCIGGQTAPDSMFVREQ